MSEVDQLHCQYIRKYTKYTSHRWYFIILKNNKEKLEEIIKNIIANIEKAKWIINFGFF